MFLGILLQQQEKLKQKIYGEQQQLQQQQQHSIVPLTPESVARFLANQSQPQVSDHHHHNPWSIHHSISAPTFPTYMENDYYDTCQSINTDGKLVDDDVILSLLDDYTGKIKFFKT